MLILHSFGRDFVPYNEVGSSFETELARISPGTVEFYEASLGVCAVAGDEPREQILSSPPLLCVEILSKDDRMSEMQERIDDYLSFGVRYVWVIDPRTKRAYVHTSEGIRETREALRTQNPDIVVPLDELFAQSGG